MKEWMIRHNGFCKACNKAAAAMQPYADYVISCGDPVAEGKNAVCLRVDSAIEGYVIRVEEAQEDTQTVEIVGQDEAHLFYGVCDFEAYYLPFAATREDRLRRQNTPCLFEQPLPAYLRRTKPRIRRRGIWTWGHTVYDYRRFIDHMVRLKMNTLILWNDYIPTNMEEVLAYAHENYVKVYLGYAWGWDVTMPDCIDEGYMDRVAERAVATYREQYAALPCDGIYFQTVTEHANEEIGGVSVAEAVVNMVNRAGGRLLAEFPQLEILFGLHAMPVRNKLDIVAGVDGRISLIWEDAGTFPWHYYADDMSGFADTVAFTRRIRDLRADGGFGGVLKGYVNLDWAAFRHQSGPAPIGITHERQLDTLSEQRRGFRRYFQAVWLRYAPKALELLQEFREDSLMTVLVEDACFEQGIPFPAALYGEMLWDAHRDMGELLYEVGLRADVQFD